MKEYLKVIRFCVKESIQIAPLLTLSLAILIFVNAQIPFVISKISSEIINKLIDFAKDPKVGFGALTMLALLWALSESISTILNRLSGYLDRVWRYKIQTFSEKKLMEHSSSMDIGRLESRDFLNLKQRALRRDIWPVTEIFTYFVNLVRPISIIITASLIIGFLDWRIYIITLISIIPSIIIEKKYGKKSFSIWNSGNGEERRTYYRFKYMVTDGDPLPEIKRFGAVNFFKDRVNHLFDKTTDELVRNEKGRFNKYWIVEIVNVICFILTIFILLTHITDGKILIGAFLFYSQTIDRFSSAVSSIFLGITYQEENILLTKDIIKYFEIKPLIQTHKPVKINPRDFVVAPEIEFKNVVFKYPDTDKVILDNVSFKINSGERIGLIGINGAGKSTIVKLLLRIYDPNEGEVLINGIDLRNIKPEDWWFNLSTLMQDYNHYSGITLAESVMISNYNKSGVINKKKLKEALIKSRALEFVNKWDKKTDSMLGKSFGGESLSNGQAQKLALARTFYKDSSVMIFDEPTAAIDAESEIEIFEELEKIPRTKSILYISHDMATIKKADRIMLIENGKIVENGNHDELIEKDGHYARIYNAQLQNLTKSTS